MADEMFVVVWDCLSPRAVAVFDRESDAKTFAAGFKTELEAWLKRIGLKGDERIYVNKSPRNPTDPKLTTA